MGWEAYINNEIMNLKNIIIITFLISICIPNVRAQDINKYYFELNVANNLAKVGEIDSAIATYEDAFKKRDFVSAFYFKKVLKLANLKKDKVRIEKYIQKIKKQSKGTNPYLKAIIDSLLKKDQEVRTALYVQRSAYAWKCDNKPNCNKQSKRYKRAKKYLDNWEKRDSLDTYFLLNLFKKYGFIGEELIGFDGYVNIITILIHFDRDTNNAVLEPVLRKALNEGKIWPIDFAVIIDRHLKGDMKIQKYWLWPDFKSKKKYSFTKEDIPEIIKLRENIGIYDSSLRQEKRGKYWYLISKTNR